MKRWIVLGACAAVALVAIFGWNTYSPYWTVRQLEAAAERGDVQAMNRYLDLASLKSGLNRDLQSSQSFKKDLRLEQVDAMLSQNSMDTLMASLSSPEGIHALLSDPPESVAPDPGILHVQRESLATFKLRDEEGGALVFHRLGLGWKLSGIQLPIQQPVSSGTHSQVES